MAQQYIDAAIATEKESMTETDGSGLTLTNDVRVLYEDTLDSRQLHVLLTRIRDRITQVLDE